MARTKYTYEVLQPIVAESYQWAEVCRKLGIKPFTGAQWHLTKRAKALGVDYSHFKGQGWSRGKAFPQRRRPLAEYLVADGPFIKSDELKKRLIRDGVKAHQCEACGITQWMKRPAPIELDHINGNHYDNRLENLRILCPNCHSQTETFSTKNIGSYTAEVVERNTLCT